MAVGGLVGTAAVGATCFALGRCGGSSPSLINVSRALGSNSNLVFSSALLLGSHKRPKAPALVNTSWTFGTAFGFLPPLCPAAKGPGARGNGKHWEATGRVPPKSFSNWCRANELDNSEKSRMNTIFCRCLSVIAVCTMPETARSMKGMLQMKKRATTPTYCWLMTFFISSNEFKGIWPKDSPFKSKITLKLSIRPGTAMYLKKYSMQKTSTRINRAVPASLHSSGGARPGRTTSAGRRQASRPPK
mmetsp:Transcript_68789/g.194158  ORF Transcript_68789/g.194158 Transcript_68789/m.194158 type:complete len:246 (+) Transcript_68789:367-1104(+)